MTTEETSLVGVDRRSEGSGGVSGHDGGLSVEMADMTGGEQESMVSYTIATAKMGRSPQVLPGDAWGERPWGVRDGKDKGLKIESVDNGR